MLKFIVVIHKQPEMTTPQFETYFKEVHGPMAMQIPGLRRYVRNFPALDPSRPHPAWDAVIELFFDDWQAMEHAWDSPQGRQATDDLSVFADLQRTTWSVVHEDVAID
jgi:uncharacterized protein (TIGR02118 family)